MDATIRKQNGVHYTPPALAEFLARQTAFCFQPTSAKTITVLDPACGDGELLASLVSELRGLGLDAIKVVGFDTDPIAVQLTEQRLALLKLVNVSIHQADFLCHDFAGQPFDCVIANPPYVRTQVLGGAAAQSLAKKFNLKGRIDLYQAFAVAISNVLKTGGAMGLLTSNRFLTVKSGKTMRQLLRESFDLRQIFDLGDTRIFDAAVLPVVVTGTKHDLADNSDLRSSHATEFHRVYCVGGETIGNSEAMTVLDAIENIEILGEVDSTNGRLLVERGELAATEDHSVWTLANATTRKWLNCVKAKQVRSFGDLAEIKVGIKTTADAVFIREDWGSPAVRWEVRPERKLLQPLITHRDALRWSIHPPEKRVLYPYDLRKQKRTPVLLDMFPKAAAYLERHRERLEGRKYVIESGRNWYEIWVPHQPADWARPKIVWPDISEQPKFFLDISGAIVNGDCYWIKLRDGVDPDWLYLMLAVANSSVATKYYDTVFHNKLYAGRRRFMTQYVKQFPLPEMESAMGKRIVRLVKQLVKKPTEEVEAQVETLVLESFGF